MSRRLVSLCVLTVLLVFTFSTLLRVQKVEASGTIYIRADGSIDPPDAPISTVDNVTYTLTGNITSDADGIVVQRSNTTIDGAGYTVEGTRAYESKGIDLAGRSNVTIKNLKIKRFYWGIKLDASSNNSIQGNDVANNWAGIGLSGSPDNFLRDNSMVGNNRNFGVYGYEYSHFVQDIDSSNTVDGKAVYYWVNVQNATVPIDAGYVALVNCTGITVQNLNLTNNIQCILLAFSENSTITGNSIINDGDGIGLHGSSNNIICGNNVTANKGYGIWLLESSNNSIVQNNMVSCSRAIDIEMYVGYPDYFAASNNEIVENNIEYREWGVRLSHASNNTLRGNNITGIFYPYSTGVYLYGSLFNSITQNTIKESEKGMELIDSHGNHIVQNIVSTTTDWLAQAVGILLQTSTHNIISQNDITQNCYGLLIKYSYTGYTNTIYHNNFVNNTYGIYLQQFSNNTISGNSFWNDGLFVWDSYENLVVDNLVNGKPLVYLEGASGLRVEDAGQVILVGCNNITVENLNLSNTVVAIQLWKTDNTKISLNNIANNMYGIDLHSSSNNSFVGNTISHNKRGGIRLSGTWGPSNYNNIIGNNITNNDGDGIGLYWSSNYNSISGNTITNNSMGIWLDQSSNNTISGNNIANNQHGISLSSSYNKIWHNNFINNTWQASSGWVNVWDDGYPSGGNYWNSYAGVDSDPDGIGDSWYEIDSSNIDHYPLMGTFCDFNVTYEHHVQTICNSSISDFQFNGTTISFDVTGDNGTAGFCRICIPTGLMNTTYKVFVNGTEISYNLLSCSNETHSYLYFNYTHSTQEVIIMPEFPSFLVLPLFMIATLLAVIAYRKKRISTR